MSRNRIYELDLFRGIAFILMVVDHLTFDIVGIFHSFWLSILPKSHFLLKFSKLISQIRYSEITRYFRFIFIAGVFLFISGICTTLSRNNLKRGIRLLLVSICLTIVTLILAILIQDYALIIYFGILHCLSVSMILSQFLKKLPNIVLLLISIVIIALGLYFSTITVNTWILIPFNIVPHVFQTADFYPLLPFLGIFILGIIFGKIFYQDKKSLFNLEYKNNLVTYFGRNAMYWYIIHQILLVVVLGVFTFILMLIY